MPRETDVLTTSRTLLHDGRSEVQRMPSKPAAHVLCRSQQTLRTARCAQKSSLESERPRSQSVGTRGPYSLQKVLRDATIAARRLVGDPSRVYVLRSIIDRLMVAALAADTHGRHVVVNAAAALTGYTVSELMGEYQLLTKDKDAISTEYAASTDVLPGLHLSRLRAQP